jgi:WD40 repeat protein
MVAALGAVDRSQHLFVNAGGDSGVMTVTRVPADAEIYTDFPVGKASLPIHCGRVSALCFIEEGTRLVTAGAEDGLIKVWQVAYDTEEPDPVVGGEGEGGDAAAVGEEEGGPVKVIYDSAEEEDWFDGPQLVRHLGTKPPVDRPDAAIAPWLAQVDQSEEGLETMFKSSKDRLVADELELDWVYGYSSRSTRGTVRYGRGGRIIYPAGCLGVILDKNVPSGGVPTQSYFMGHCDEITCLDLHAASGNVASGHKGTGEITLCVWSSATGATLQRLSCGPVLGLSAVAFSPSGNIVAAACQDEDHTVLIFHWRSGQLQASFKGGPRKVLALTFSLGSTETAQRLLQTGITHFQLADVGGSKGRLVSKKTGLYGAGSKKLTIACAAALPLSPEGGNEFIVALRGGVGVIARGERKLASTVDVFPGGFITALTVVVVKEATADMPPVFRVVAGGRNMEVRLLDGEFGVAAVFNLAKPEYGLTEQGGARGLKSLCVDRTGRKLLYGTSAGEVGEIDTEKGLDINAELPNKPGGPIVRAHYKDQLHAMATHPIRQELATAGDDKSLRVWDMETKALMGQINLPDICRSICWAPNGHILICGLGGVVPPTNDPEAPPRSVPREFDGKVVIVSFLQNVLNVVHIAGDAFEGITSVVYAPDGSKVFCASLDTNIYVYNALDNFKLFMVLKAHSEGVDTLDITADGKCLVSTSVAGEVMLWDVDTLEDKPSPAIPDISKLKKPWYMRQGTRNYNSTGIFAPYSKAEAVTALGLSKDERLFVTGDRFGSIFLLRNPSIRLGAPSKRYLAHTPGGVSKTAFSIDDKYAVSIGRTDRCIVQWRLVRSQVEPEVREKEWEAPEIKAKVAGGVATGPFAETFIVTGTSLVTGRAEGEGDEGSEKPDSDGAAAAADAAAAAAALAGATPMDPPSQAHYIGSTNVADTSETLVSLYNNALEQMRRPVSAYVGMGDVLTISGKRLVSLGSDRFSQNNWRHAGSAGEAEVSALAVTGCARFVAVGTGPDLKLEPGSPEHEGFKGSLSVFSASSGAVIAVLSPEVPGGVVSVDFSHDNKYLACVAGGTRHAVTVYSSMTGQWNDALLVYAGEGTALKVSSLAFVSPDDADAASSTVRFATAGACSTKFWTVSGRNVTALVGPEHEAAVLEAWNAAAAVEGADPTPLPTPAQTLCLLGLPASALGAGLLLAGADDGSLYLWEGCGMAPRRPLVSHESGAALSAVAPYFKNGALEGVTSGSRDCVTISTLSRSSAGDLVASPLFSFSTASLYAPLSSAASIAKSVERAVKGLDGGDYVFVTSISPDALGQRVLLSLSCNAVLELSIDSGAVLTITEGLLPRVSVNGIAAHPSEPCTVVTTHGNNCVRVWDLSFPARECVAVLPLTHQPDGVCFLSDTIIAVGICKGDTGGASGGILFLELSAPEPLAAPAGVAASGRVQRGVHRTLKVLSKFHNVGRGQVNCLRPSPSGKFLAAASDDGQVYLYGTDTSSKELGKLSALAGKPVKSVDWSSDGRFLRAFGVTEAGDAVIKSKYFDFEDESDGVAFVVRDSSVVQQLRACTWASCSSAGALEARAAHPASEAGAAAFSPAAEEIARQRGSQVTSVCSAGPGAALAVSYNDGTTQLFRSFAVAGAGHRIVDGHSPGPVASTFTASGQLVTLGAQDGCFLVWTLPPAPTPASV